MIYHRVDMTSTMTTAERRDKEMKVNYFLKNRTFTEMASTADARLCRVRVGELQYRARDFKGAGDVRIETFRLRATSENNVTRKRVTPDIRGKKKQHPMDGHHDDREERQEAQNKKREKHFTTDMITAAGWRNKAKGK